MPGIAGLEAGLRFVREKRGSIERHERALIARLPLRCAEWTALRSMPRGMLRSRSGVLSFNLDGREPEKTADALAQRGFALRGGLHCAPYAHRTAGTLPNGTVRLSVSAFTSAADIDAFYPCAAEQRARLKAALHKFMENSCSFGCFFLRIILEYE